MRSLNHMGFWLRCTRESLGLSHAEVARKLLIRPQELWAWEERVNLSQGRFDRAMAVMARLTTKRA